MKILSLDIPIYNLIKIKSISNEVLDIYKR